MAERYVFLLSCLLGIILSVFETHLERRVEGSRQTSTSIASGSSRAKEKGGIANVGGGTDELIVRDTRLNTMELEIDRSNDGNVDQWVVSTESDPSGFRFLADGLNAFLNYADDDYDGVAEKIVASIGPESDRTEVIVDKGLGRRDWIVTTKSGEKYGYSDLDMDGMVDLISILSTSGGTETSVIRYIVKEHKMLAVIRKVKNSEMEYVVSTETNGESLVRWIDGDWEFSG